MKEYSRDPVMSSADNKVVERLGHLKFFHDTKEEFAGDCPCKDDEGHVCGYISMVIGKYATDLIEMRGDIQACFTTDRLLHDYQTAVDSGRYPKDDEESKLHYEYKKYINQTRKEMIIDKQNAYDTKIIVTEALIVRKLQEIIDVKGCRRLVKYFDELQEKIN